MKYLRHYVYYYPESGDAVIAKVISIDRSGNRDFGSYHQLATLEIESSTYVPDGNTTYDDEASTVQVVTVERLTNVPIASYDTHDRYYSTSNAPCWVPISKDEWFTSDVESIEAP